jgi:hypothetical protein
VGRSAFLVRQNVPILTFVSLGRRKIQLLSLYFIFSALFFIAGEAFSIMAPNTFLLVLQVLFF